MINNDVNYDATKDVEMEQRSVGEIIRDSSDIIDTLAGKVGRIVSYRYKIYIRKETIFEESNNTDFTWVYLDTLESNILDMSVYIDFYKSGNFKIEVQAFDKSGLGSEIKELFIDIECQTSKDQCTGYFDWSKTTSMLKFNIEEQKLNFRIEEQKLNFRIEEQKLNFKILEEEIKFKIAEEIIKFTLNCKSL